MNEAELLFSELLKLPNRTSLYRGKNIRLNRKISLQAASILQRRINGEPLQYILGKADFMGLEFKVNKNVLIPRPETEILVEKTMEIVRDAGSGIRRVLEIGTGSGCIAVSLAKFMPEVEITATDILPVALDVATFNARKYGVADRINFVLSDLFSSYELRARNYELIISNPPYIASAEIANLQPEIQYEPRLALDGGVDGLDFYRLIIRGSAHFLNPGGLLAMEMGCAQAALIRGIVEGNTDFTIRDIIKDYSGIERVMVLEKNG